MSNFIPNEDITINDKDSPWITSNIKSKITRKNSFFQKYIKNGRTAQDLDNLDIARSNIIDAIKESKRQFYERINLKLINPNTSPKTYWSILKSLFCDKKIPVIPHLVHNNEIITDFKSKADLFNSQFSRQCSLVDNDSTLPLTSLFPLSHPALSSFVIDTDSILKKLLNYWKKLGRQSKVRGPQKVRGLGQMSGLPPSKTSTVRVP